MPKEELRDGLAVTLVDQTRVQHENASRDVGGRAVLPLQEETSYPNSLANDTASRAMPARRMRLNWRAMPTPDPLGRARSQGFWKVNCESYMAALA